MPALLAVGLVTAEVDNAYIIIVGISSISVIFYVITSAVQAEGDKQIRRLLLMPVSAVQAEWVQISLFIMYMGGLALIWAVTWLAAPSEPFTAMLLRVVTLNSTMSSWVFFFWACSDLNKTGMRVLKAVFPALVLIPLGGLIVLGYLYGFRLMLLPSFKGTNPVLLSEMTGTLLILAAMITAQYSFFLKRRTYFT